MTDNDAYLDRLLSFDSLAQAEDLTGKDYKTDPVTSDLGFMMHIENGKRKREALEAAHDTHYSIEFTGAVDVALDLGFEPVYAQVKTKRDLPVHYNLYWRAGILLALESYEHRLNLAQMYFNYRNPDGKTEWPDWQLGLSGGWSRYTPGFDGELDDDPWTLTVHASAVEGLRHKIGRLETLPGSILEEWYIQPSMYLISHAERESNYAIDSGSGFSKSDEVTQAKLAALPPKLRDMILAAKGPY